MERERRVGERGGIEWREREREKGGGEREREGVGEREREKGGGEEEEWNGDRERKGEMDGDTR